MECDPPRIYTLGELINNRWARKCLKVNEIRGLMVQGNRLVDWSGQVVAECRNEREAELRARAILGV